jgi:hypothetical protein
MHKASSRAAAVNHSTCHLRYPRPSLTFEKPTLMSLTQNGTSGHSRGDSTAATVGASSQLAHRWRRQSRANSSLKPNSLLAGKIQGIFFVWAFGCRCWPEIGTTGIRLFDIKLNYVVRARIFKPRTHSPRMQIRAPLAPAGEVHHIPFAQPRGGRKRIAWRCARAAVGIVRPQ